MMCKTRVHQSGFTLIEIVIIVLFVAFLGVMTLTFISKSLIDTRDPVRRLRQSSYLHAIMANITADYNKYPKWRRSTSYPAGNYVVPTIRNGHFYASGGGTSGSTEPINWPTASAATVSDGGVTWTESGSLLTLSNLQTNINNKNYGTYDIVYNAFIDFPVGSDMETAGGGNILRVTIRNDQGESLTALFIAN
jgi:type II secretory pathway pseudopilin PulG